MADVTSFIATDLPQVREAHVLPEAVTTYNPKLVERMYGTMVEDRAAFDLFYDYLNGKQLLPHSTARVTPQIKDLQERSITNIMPLLIGLPAEISYVDGYRRDVLSTESDNDRRFPREYEEWQRNRMDSKQGILYRSAGTFGHAFAQVEKEVVNGEPHAKDNILSTRDTVAYFQDPVNDINPAAVLTVLAPSYVNADNEVEYGLAKMWDSVNEYVMDWNGPGDFSIRSVKPHGFSHTPVVRYPCYLDDEGRTTGLIENSIASQNRVNQASFSTLITADVGAFKVKTASGLEPDIMLDADGNEMVDATGNPIYVPIEVAQDKVWISQHADTKFGTLDASDLEPYLKNEEQSFRAFAMINQLPPGVLLGNMSNISAEGLQAAEQQFFRLVDHLHVVWGECHEELFRLNAEAIGDADGAKSYGGEVRWRDCSSRSLSAVSDGIAKLVQNAGVPPEGAWPLIPGVTSGQLQEWGQMKNEAKNQIMTNDPSTNLRDSVDQGSDPNLVIPEGSEQASDLVNGYE